MSEFSNLALFFFLSFMQWLAQTFYLRFSYCHRIHHSYTSIVYTFTFESVWVRVPDIFKERYLVRRFRTMHAKYLTHEHEQLRWQKIECHFRANNFSIFSLLTFQSLAIRLQFSLWSTFHLEISSFFFFSPLTFSLS